RVQYFERARFEYHPEHTPPYDVELGLLTAYLTQGRVFPKGSPLATTPRAATPASSATPTTPSSTAVPPGQGSTDFSPTRHRLGGVFLSYWQGHGGLASIGFPISEPLSEVSQVDGKTYTVQYFERARLEYHPENTGSAFTVLLGLMGV